MVPTISDSSYRIKADVEVTSSGRGQGIILACGNRFGGYVLYGRDGAICFDYIFTESHSYKIRTALRPGRHLYTVFFQRTGEYAGTFELGCDGRVEDRVEVQKTWHIFGISAGLTCGYSNVPIIAALPPPATFESTLHSVVFEVMRDQKQTPDAFGAILEEE